CRSVVGQSSAWYFGVIRETLTSIQRKLKSPKSHLGAVSSFEGKSLVTSQSPDSPRRRGGAEDWVILERMLAISQVMRDDFVLRVEWSSAIGENAFQAVGYRKPFWVLRLALGSYTRLVLRSG